MFASAYEKGETKYHSDNVLRPAASAPILAAAAGNVYPQAGDPFNRRFLAALHCCSEAASVDSGSRLSGDKDSSSFPCNAADTVLPGVSCQAHKGECEQAGLFNAETTWSQVGTGAARVGLDQWYIGDCSDAAVLVAPTTCEKGVQVRAGEEIHPVATAGIKCELNCDTVCLPAL